MQLSEAVAELWE